MDSDLERKLDAILTEQHQTTVEVARLGTLLDRGVRDTADHEDRIRSLESMKWKIMGMAAAVATVLSGAWNGILSTITGR